MHHTTILAKELLPLCPKSSAPETLDLTLNQKLSFRSLQVGP